MILGRRYCFDLGNSADMSLNIYLLFLKAEYSRKPSEGDVILIFHSITGLIGKTRLQN